MNLFFKHAKILLTLLLKVISKSSISYYKFLIVICVIIEISFIHKLYQALRFILKLKKKHIYLNFKITHL